MIRKQVTYLTTEDIEIDYSYNHEVMKNIHFYLSVADDVLNKRIHNEGFELDDGKVFKLFNHAVLFEGVEFKKDKIVCKKGSKIKLIISGRKDIVKKILKGVLQIKKIKLFENQIPLQSIQNDRKVWLREITLYKAISPVIETTMRERGGKLKRTALSVYEDDYYKNLVQNAKRKYKLIYGKDYEGEMFFDIDDALKIKEKMVKFKDSYTKGYQFDIWIQADPDMQKVIYYLGLGQSSSIGMGCLSFITGVRADE